MRDKHADTRKVILPKLTPQALIKATDAIIRIRRTLPIRNPIKEVPIICPLLPHPLHLSGTGLEVAKVLLPQSGLFVDLDARASEGGGVRVVRGEGFEDPLGCFAGAAVWGGEEVEGVGWAEEFLEGVAGGVGLGVPEGR